MAEYRKIFPSYNWENDVWCVNQIVNLPNIVGKENIGFQKAVPNEEVKGYEATKKWIDENLKGCSCLVCFVGLETYKSDWVKYELEKANELNMGRFLVYLNKMKNKQGDVLFNKKSDAINPYSHHAMYSNAPSSGAYTIKEYSWVDDDGVNNIKSWIEDAIERTQS